LHSHRPAEAAGARAARLTAALVLFLHGCACVSNASGPDAESARADQKAVRRVIEHERVLRVKALAKARAFHWEIRDQLRVCEMETLDTKIENQWRATYSAKFQCGPAGWTLERGKPLASSIVTGDLEHVRDHVWIINSLY
jgi:hypothetical protein